MASFLPRVLMQIHRHVERNEVIITRKAQVEMMALGCSPDDVYDVLAELAEDDFYERLRSEYRDEWMYVFKPWLVGTVLYLKVVLRAHCVVVSFHEDEDEDDDEE